jgi:hypothetical protein
LIEPTEELCGDCEKHDHYSNSPVSCEETYGVSKATVTESGLRPLDAMSEKYCPEYCNEEVTGLGALVMIAVFQHSIVFDQDNYLCYSYQLLYGLSMMMFALMDYPWSV